MDIRETQILVIAEKYWPLGGAELATHLTLEILRDEGFDVTVLTGSRKPRKLRGVRYVYTPRLDQPSKFHLWAEINAWKELRQIVSSSETVYVPRISYPVLQVARERDKKTVVHLHNYQPIASSSMIFRPHHDIFEIPLLGDGIKSGLFEILEHRNPVGGAVSLLASPLNVLVRRWLAESDVLICVSKRQAQLLCSDWSAARPKIRVIYNPIPDVRTVNVKPPGKTFIYTGGDSYCKGFPLLITALRRMLGEAWNVDFILAGRYRRSSFSRERLTHPSVKNVGLVSHDKILRLYGLCRGLIFPALAEEPLPYSIIEGMLSSTIPIASRIGGIPEIVRGTVAERFLFEPGNPSQCVQGVRAVADLSADELTDYGDSMRETILTRFDKASVRRRLAEVFG